MIKTCDNCGKLYSDSLEGEIIAGDSCKCGSNFIIKEDIHKTYIVDLVKENKNLKNLLRQLFYHRRNETGTKIENEISKENYNLWKEIHEVLYFENDL